VAENTAIMSKLLQIAFEELYTKEIKGSQHNPRIVEYAEKSNLAGIQDDETPWCSTFVNFVCHEANLPKTNRANARSWLQIGRAVNDPAPGDIVIFWRESPHSWKGHVGFFLGFNIDKSQVFCLGGNQGDQVSIAPYDAAKVLGYRRLEETETIELPKGVIRLDDRGSNVIQLQKALNFLGYNCGDPDGHFGPKTESALKLLQANLQLNVDGVYGPKTRTAMTSLMQS
jgi:uncharacterized protein (TIGR02594 family)